MKRVRFTEEQIIVAGGRRFRILNVVDDVKYGIDLWGLASGFARGTYQEDRPGSCHVGDEVRLNWDRLPATQTKRDATDTMPIVHTLLRRRGFCNWSGLPHRGGPSGAKA
jgi:hypothetical protein